MGSFAYWLGRTEWIGRSPPWIQLGGGTDNVVSVPVGFGFHEFRSLWVLAPL